MDNFEIQSDLTISNTKIILDGKEVSKKENVVGINFYASSPVKDSEYDSGWIDLSLTVVDDNGNVETKSYRKSEYTAKKIPMGKPIKDFLQEKGCDQVVQYIGNEVSKEKKELVDKMIDHCKEKDIPCPDNDTLYARTIESLQDKATDLGIDI